MDDVHDAACLSCGGAVLGRAREVAEAFGLSVAADPRVAPQMGGARGMTISSHTEGRVASRRWTASLGIGQGNRGYRIKLPVPAVRAKSGEKTAPSCERAKLRFY